MLRHYIRLFTLTVVIGSCGGPIFDAEAVRQQQSSKLKYKIYDDPGSQLFIYHVFSPIKVHVEGSYGLNFRNAQQIVDAIGAWMKPLREISNRALTRQISVGKYPRDYHLRIELKNECGTASAGLNTILFYLKTSDGRGNCIPTSADTLLHELGHSFGLRDTYDGVGGCQPGEPDSLMCHLRSNLTNDDIAGVTAMFCKVFPNNCTGSKAEDSHSTPPRLALLVRGPTEIVL